MLTGKLAVITGGGSGIGRAICQQFARHGASVVVADIKKEEAQKTLDSLPVDYVLKQKGEEVGFGIQKHISVKCDVSGAEFVNQLRDYVISEFKATPEILVNNAGITMDGLMHKMTEQQFDWVMDINLKGTFLMTQAFTQAMVANGISGSVINISSIVGKTGNIGQSNYAASKAAVIGLTKTVAKELGPKGIRVNAVLPGFIRTPMTEKVPEKILEATRAQIPLKELGEPEDIADTCIFLASNMARYITGACVEVTGGLGM